MNHESRREDFLISTDKTLLDSRTIHNFLSQSYWAKGIPIEVVKRSIENSLCFGVYKNHQQIGFARLVTDYATYAYLADVFILEGFRGQGLSKWLLETIISHPDLQGLRRWMLATHDAHELYRKYGFNEIRLPERWMERHFPDLYVRK
jgi:GNAT superfamily N-acetyltransferase